MDESTSAALARLLSVAYQDTGQSRRVVSFLLAWWNAGTCGGFDLTDMWGLDQSLREDILCVFTFVAFDQNYPDTLGRSREFLRVLRRWRPHLLEPRQHDCAETACQDEADDVPYEDVACALEFGLPIASAQVDPDVFMAEMTAAAERGDREAREFLDLFSRWELKFGAKLIKRT